jgi:hypothetical protein
MSSPQIVSYYWYSLIKCNSFPSELNVILLSIQGAVERRYRLTHCVRRVDLRWNVGGAIETFLSTCLPPPAATHAWAVAVDRQPLYGNTLLARMCKNIDYPSPTMIWASTSIFSQMRRISQMYCSLPSAVMCEYCYDCFNNWLLLLLDLGRHVNDCLVYLVSARVSVFSILVVQVANSCIELGCVI